MISSLISWSYDNLIIFHITNSCAFSSKVTNHTISIFSAFSAPGLHILTKTYFQFRHMFSAKCNRTWSPSLRRPIFLGFSAKCFSINRPRALAILDMQTTYRHAIQSILFHKPVPYLFYNWKKWCYSHSPYLPIQLIPINTLFILISFLEDTNKTWETLLTKPGTWETLLTKPGTFSIVILPAITLSM